VNFYFASTGSRGSKTFNALFLAGSRHMLHSYANNDPVSFAAYCKSCCSAAPDFHLMVDSGAFPMWKSGKRVDLHKYADTVTYSMKLLSHYVKSGRLYFVSLDDIPDGVGRAECLESARKSYSNFEYLYKRVGRGIIPVFHRGESMSMLSDYCAACGYVGLGLGNTLSLPARIQFVTECFDHVGSVKKFHLFGVYNLALFRACPAYSADTASANYSVPIISRLHAKIMRGKKLQKFSTYSMRELRARSMLNNVAAITEYWKGKGVVFNDM